MFKGIIWLFGKRLTVIKLINLHGYSMIPRLLISVPATLYVKFLMSDDSKIEMMLGEIPFWFKIVAVISGIFLFYGIFLYIYGIVVSPNIEKKEEHSEISVNQPLQ